MPETPSNSHEENQRRKEEKITLAKELFESGEIFIFPEITTEVYTKIKDEEEQFPGYSTPIDELLVRCRNEGIKVVLGAHPESGNVFILPATSNDIENDCLFPRQLNINNVEVENLRNLVLLDGGHE